MINLAVVTPSRGLIHSRTVEAIHRNVRAFDPFLLWNWYISHDLPIPDCFNDTVQRAYDSESPVIWIVEEDVRPSMPTLRKMMLALTQGADAATVPYPVGDWEKTGLSVIVDGAGRTGFCGTGCFLMRREVLERTPRPWFTLENRLMRDGKVQHTFDNPSPYGADIAFSFTLTQMGIEIAVVESEIEHLRVIARGDTEVNKGFHTIRPLPEPVPSINTARMPRRSK